MASLAQLSLVPVFYNGAPVVGAQVYVYDSGTLLPRTAYTDATSGPVWPHPFLTDGSGSIPPFFLGGTLAYRVRIVHPSGVLIRDIDGIELPVSGGSGGGGDPGDGTVIPPGSYLAIHFDGPVSGWVRANGRTIGSASSGATERANADTEAAFSVLWSDTSLTVSGGRGANAASDFAANKTIALPDLRGRSPVGLDTMGNSAAGRFTGFTFSGGSSTAIGSVGGAATVTLITGQLPVHTHTGSASTAPNHTHTFTTSVQPAHDHGAFVTTAGSHVHTGATDTAPDHTHSVSVGGTTANVNSPGGQAVAILIGGSTGAAGAHAHTLNTDVGGSHNHAIAADGLHWHTGTADANGSHTHTITIGNEGSGAAHPNMPPFLLVTWLIKL